MMGKCKFYKKCALYDSESNTCNIYDGDYGEKEASCKIKLEEQYGNKKRSRK